MTSKKIFRNDLNIRKYKMFFINGGSTFKCIRNLVHEAFKSGANREKNEKERVTILQE